MLWNPASSDALIRWAGPLWMDVALADRKSQGAVTKLGGPRCGPTTAERGRVDDKKVQLRAILAGCGSSRLKP
jgi:hypothetical protein